MAGRQALTTGDVARFCGVSFRTVIRWIDADRLPAYQLPGRGDHRVSVDDFLRFLDQHNMPVPEELMDRRRRVLLLTQSASRLEAPLAQAGFEVVAASDAFRAGQLLHSFTPVVTILDAGSVDIELLDQVLGGLRASGEGKLPRRVIWMGTNPDSAPDSVDRFVSVDVDDEQLVQEVSSLISPMQFATSSN